jgi:TolB protein
MNDQTEEVAQRKGWTRRLGLILLALVIAACVGTAALAAGAVLMARVLSNPRPVTIPATVTPSPMPPGTGETPPAAQGAPAARTGDAGVLAVQSATGNIFTVRPDGSDRRDFTSDASPQHQYRQPAWSPDGAALAWSETLAERGRDANALYIQRLDEGIAGRIDTGSFAPFYISWSPDSRQASFLSNWERGLALRRVETSGDQVSLMAEGQPLYFAWAPDSTRLLAHIGADRLDIVSLDGSAAPLGVAPGDSTAPAWLPDDSLLYVVRRLDGQGLVLGSVDGRELKELARVDGQISFSPDPAGARVAYAVTRLEAPTNAFGPLSVVDIAGGETRTITQESVLAFFWSPDGRSLAYLTPDSVGPGQAVAPLNISDRAQHEAVWLRWHVWDGDRSYRLGSFVPSDVYLLEYLRFFDQYARGMTPWSPDGSAFVYAGSDGSGEDAIWVQPVTTDGVARRVADGVYAAWSPR